MNAMRLASFPALLLLACGCSDPPPTLLGTLEWDLVELPAVQSERLDALHVVEGEQVAAGQLLAELDASLLQAELDAARAESRRASQALAERVEGPRRERINAAFARLERARSTARNAAAEFQRIERLVGDGLLPVAERDRALAARDGAQAQVDAAGAELAELTAGTRGEQLRQAEAALAAAEARAHALELRIARLRLVAPRAGRVESLPFEVGDRPGAGATVVSLQVGVAPHARVYVPQPLRAGLAPGSEVLVRVEGQDRDYPGRVRHVAAEPSFTPYFALSGRDVAQLVYLAEIELGEEAAALPAGLPLSAFPVEPSP